MCLLCTCTYVRAYVRGVLIYRIGKISTADMAKFSILEIGVFEIVQIYLPIFLHVPII